MTRPPTDPTPNVNPAPTAVAPRAAPATSAQDRLAEALKANMARRKAQARVRAAGPQGDAENDNDNNGV